MGQPSFLYLLPQRRRGLKTRRNQEVVIHRQTAAHFQHRRLRVLKISTFPKLPQIGKFWAQISHFFDENFLTTQNLGKGAHLPEAPPATVLPRHFTSPGIQSNIFCAIDVYIYGHNGKKHFHSSIHTRMINIIRVWYERMFKNIIRIWFVLQSTLLLTHWSPRVQYTMWRQWVRIWQFVSHFLCACDAPGQYKRHLESWLL